LCFQQSPNFFLPRKSPHKLIEVQRRFCRVQDIAMDVNQAQVRRNRHWVYHRDYTGCDFDPIPSEPGVLILC
jgi:hypothetical protein